MGAVPRDSDGDGKADTHQEAAGVNHDYHDWGMVDIPSGKLT
jgi:hypothetical protein